MVLACPETKTAKKGKYPILDGVHRWSAYKKTGVTEIGKAIGRSRQTVDTYIADLRATALFELDLKIFKLNQLGIPQDRIAKRLGVPQQTISRYLPKMPELAKWVNSDLRVTFTLKGRNQVSERFYCPAGCAKARLA